MYLTKKNNFAQPNFCFHGNIFLTSVRWSFHTFNTGSKTAFSLKLAVQDNAPYLFGVPGVKFYMLLNRAVQITVCFFVLVLFWFWFAG